MIRIDDISRLLGNHDRRDTFCLPKGECIPQIVIVDYHVIIKPSIFPATGEKKWGGAKIMMEIMLRHCALLRCRASFGNQISDIACPRFSRCVL